MAYIYLVADIGKNNTMLKIYRAETNGKESLLTEQKINSQKYSTLPLMLKGFQKDNNIDDIVADVAVISVAGPVYKGFLNFPRLGWNITEEEVQNETGISDVRFINNFEANAHGLAALPDRNLFEVSIGGIPDEQGPKMVIGACSSLGEAFSIVGGGKRIVVWGEAGHSDFSPRTKKEFEYMVYIKNKFSLSRVSTERIVSGTGIAFIYSFFVSEEPSIENKEVTTRIRMSECQEKVISELAEKNEDILCCKTMRFFLSLYGSEVGNRALAILPTGGIYLVGGISKHFKEQLEGEFYQKFLDKGSSRNLLSKIPVYVVLDDDLTFYGARYIARSILGVEGEWSEYCLNKKGIRTVSSGRLKSIKTNEGKSVRGGFKSVRKENCVYKYKHKPEKIGKICMVVGAGIVAFSMLLFLMDKKKPPFEGENTVEL